MRKRVNKRTIHKKRMYRKCYFCENEITITYRDPATIGRFTSERGKIIERATSGSCSRHQRELSTAVLRARYLALLPYLVRPR